MSKRLFQFQAKSHAEIHANANLKTKKLFSRQLGSSITLGLARFTCMETDEVAKGLPAFGKLLRVG